MVGFNLHTQRHSMCLVPCACRHASYWKFFSEEFFVIVILERGRPWTNIWCKNVSSSLGGIVRLWCPGAGAVNTRRVGRMQQFWCGNSERTQHHQHHCGSFIHHSNHQLGRQTWICNREVNKPTPWPHYAFHFGALDAKCQKGFVHETQQVFSAGRHSFILHKTHKKRLNSLRWQYLGTNSLTVVGWKTFTSIQW